MSGFSFPSVRVQSGSERVRTRSGRGLSHRLLAVAEFHPRRGPAVESVNSFNCRLSDTRGLGVTSCFTINATQAKSSWICVTRLFSYCTREATIVFVLVSDAVFLTPAKLDSTL